MTLIKITTKIIAGIIVTVVSVFGFIGIAQALTPPQTCTAGQFFSSLSSGGTFTCGTPSGGGSVSTSSAVTANYYPFWANATGGLSGTSSIYRASPNDVTIASTTDLGLFAVVNSANITVFQIASTTNNSSSVNIIGLPMFLGSSTLVTPVISGAIVGLGCDTATSSVDSSITSSTAAFITSPTVFPGAGLFWQTYLSAPGVVTTEVCTDVTATPTASTYIIKIIK